MVNFLKNIFVRSRDPGACATMRKADPVSPPPPVRQEIHAPAGAPVPPAPAPEDAVVFSLKSITDVLPPELRETLRKQPSEHVEVRISKALILPQLGAGAVRIPFSELRASSPEVFFHPNLGRGDLPVTLPLAVVLRHCMPRKRENQRPLSVPSSVPSIFTKTGSASSAPAAQPEAWYTRRSNSPRIESTAPAESPAIPAATPVAKAPVNSPPAPAPVTPPPAHAPVPAPAAAASSSTAAPPRRAIEHLCGLSGVQGAFLATPDGLPIASQLPPGKESVLAAFAPTVFGQLTKYTDMARLGTPLSISVQVPGACLQVHRGPKFFVGILAAPEQPVPLQELMNISATLTP